MRTTKLLANIPANTASERGREQGLTAWSMDRVRNPIIKDLIIFKYGHFLPQKLSPNVFTLSILTCQMGLEGDA